MHHLLQPLAQDTKRGHFSQLTKRALSSMVTSNIPSRVLARSTSWRWRLRQGSQPQASFTFFALNEKVPSVISFFSTSRTRRIRFRIQALDASSAVECTRTSSSPGAVTEGMFDTLAKITEPSLAGHIMDVPVGDFNSPLSRTPTSSDPLGAMMLSKIPELVFGLRLTMSRW